MRSPRGFTLLEVMIGLALLGFALVVLVKGTTGNIVNAKQSQMIGVATDLARGKMYDIEEKLLKDGFTETDQSEEGRNFSDEGWPDIRYSYKVEQVELPSFDELQAISKGQGSGSGSARAGAGAGAGSDGDDDGELSSSFQDSALGGMLNMLGGGFGGGSEDIDSKAGASFIQGYYQIVQEALKVSIRKVTLTVQFMVVGEEHELKTVAFFTDPPAMDKVIPIGNNAPDDGGGGGGGGGAGGGGAPGAPGGPGSPGGPGRVPPKPQGGR